MSQEPSPAQVAKTEAAKQAVILVFAVLTMVRGDGANAARTAADLRECAWRRDQDGSLHR